jgi:hypothetical protein
MTASSSTPFMKNYPSIPTEIDRQWSYHVFDKLDGSNLRAEWNPKRGFYKFGTRTRLLGSDQPTLMPAQDLFQAKYAAELSRRFRDRRCPRALAFFEFVGPNSFAGSHTDPVAAMDVVLFDVAIHQKGLLPPTDFLGLAQGLATPRLLFQGPITEAFIESVRDGTCPGITEEGVVGKGPYQSTWGGPIQFKIKTRRWLDRLKTYCGPDDALFERLK